MNRNGKIARLPQDIREQLNRRLQDNEPGDTLLEWLNGLEAVQKVMKEQFEGKAINKQNLSEWRMGGFAEWVLGQEVVYEAQNMEEMSHSLDAVTGAALPDRLATVLAGRYASLLARWDGEVTEAFTKKQRALGPLCREICALRRSHHNAIRTKIATERHEMEKEEVRMKNEKMGKRPGNSAPSEPVRPEPMRDYFDPNDTWDGGWAGKEEGGVKNEEFGKGSGNSDASESVKPGQTSFQANPEANATNDVVTSCPHPEGTAGDGGAGSVKPSQTELRGEAPGEGHAARTSHAVATSGHHAEGAAGDGGAGSVKPSQTEYKSPITDNRIYEPMAASDPNSGDIYAIDTVPKKRNPDNYDPSPFIYPSYWLWIKMWKPKILPPGHPAKPPVIWNY